MAGLQWTVGDAVIYQVIEARADAVLNMLLSDEAPAVIAQHEILKPHFVTEDNQLTAWFQSFLVVVGGKNILIEVGIGNGRERSGFPDMHQLQTDFLANLRACGVTEAEIDYVIPSHLHIDHVGWFVTQEGDGWVPTFPNARYVVVQDEYDFWKAREAHPDQMRTFQECVVPVVEAGLVDFVSTTHELNQYIRLRPAPGHTQFHVAIELMAGDERVLFPGDVFPHPCVIFEPTLAFGSDFDPEQAIETRRALLAELADTDTLMFSPHFSNPIAVKIKSQGDGYTFEVV